MGWTIVGLALEGYGFWLLFCEFIPVVLQYSRRIPFMSKMLDVPALKAVRARRRAAGLRGAGGACLRQQRQWEATE